MESELFIKIALAILSIIGAIITGVLIPYLRTKISANKLVEIQYWVNAAVTAAEQIFKYHMKNPKQSNLTSRWCIHSA